MNIMVKISDAYKFSGKVPKQGIDYIETDNTFTIFNVPILAEMVQSYGVNRVYKSADEILKVEVNNIPLTIVDDEPTHPKHLNNSNTLEKRDVVVGYMSEPVLPKSNKSKTKRYADFVLHNTSKIDYLKKKYLDGTIIDTSIGFNCEDVMTSGVFNGEIYDYVQKNIILDHNAILINRVGDIGVGRMPAPIGGIGADKADLSQIGGHKMENKDKIDALTKESNDLKKENVSLKKASDDLKKESDELKKEIADIKKQIEKKDSAEEKDIDKVKKSLDEAKTESDKLKLEKKDVEDELKKVKNDLKVYTDKEQSELDKKKDELKKQYPDFADQFDKFDADFINKKYEGLKDKQKNKDIGADMFGVGSLTNVKKEAKNFDRVYGKKKDKSDNKEDN